MDKIKKNIKTIHVLITGIDIPDAKKQECLNCKLLPKFLVDRMNRYKHPKEKFASLVGYRLLLHCLTKYDIKDNDLSNLCVDNFGRPFSLNEFDFNISHSGDYTVLALSWAGKVGIDIQKIKKIGFDDIKHVVTGNEYDTVIESKKPMDTFYDLWTKKESILKAIGCGLNTTSKQICYLNCNGTNGIPYYIHDIFVNTNYKCKVATNISGSEIVIENIDLETLGLSMSWHSISATCIKY